MALRCDGPDRRLTAPDSRAAVELTCLQVVQQQRERSFDFDARASDKWPSHILA